MYAWKYAIVAESPYSEHGCTMEANCTVDNKILSNLPAQRNKSPATTNSANKCAFHNGTCPWESNGSAFIGFCRTIARPTSVNTDCFPATAVRLSLIRRLEKSEGLQSHTMSSESSSCLASRGLLWPRSLHTLTLKTAAAMLIVHADSFERQKGFSTVSYELLECPEPFCTSAESVSTD